VLGSNLHQRMYVRSDKTLFCNMRSCSTEMHLSLPRKYMMDPAGENGPTALAGNYDIGTEQVHQNPEQQYTIDRVSSRESGNHPS
jgi:hypothetical protein